MKFYKLLLHKSKSSGDSFVAIKDETNKDVTYKVLKHKPLDSFMQMRWSSFGTSITFTNILRTTDEIIDLGTYLTMSELCCMIEMQKLVDFEPDCFVEV